MNSYAQNEEISYEQKSLNFLIDTILPEKFEKVKYLIFNNKIDSDISEEYCYCYNFSKKIKKKNQEKYSKILSINSSNYKVVKKSNLFLKWFISKNKIGKIYVLEYSKKDNKEVFISIQFDYKGNNYFYTFLIDENNKKVIDYCFKKLIS